MLVHANMMNIHTFSTQFFKRNQTRPDVCTEQNKFEKTSIFTIVGSSNSSPQKFILQLKVNITTWFCLSFARITGPAPLLLTSQHQLQPYHIRPLQLIAILFGFNMKTNTLCFACEYFDLESHFIFLDII